VPISHIFKACIITINKLLIQIAQCALFCFQKSLHMIGEAIRLIRTRFLYNLNQPLSIYFVEGVYFLIVIL
jgi:hypothetical protein